MLKQANLVSKTHFDNKLISFNRKITSKNKLSNQKFSNLEIRKKLNSLITKDSVFFLGRIYFASNDASQNTFIYQPRLDTLELNKDKGTDYVLSWNSKRVYNSKRKRFYTAFLHSIKFSGYKTGIKFDKDPLAVEQNNYASKIIKCLHCM